MDTAGAPAPGPENFYRGGDLSTHAAETGDCWIAAAAAIDHHAALETWLLALESRWQADRCGCMETSRPATCWYGMDNCMR